MFCLAQCLIKLGHKVIILTHHYGDRQGVRYLTNGLKVYYIPKQEFVLNTTFVSFEFLLPILRQIVVREQIDIIHGHQSASLMTLEAMWHARTLGVKFVLTEHSLYQLDSFGGLWLAKVIKSIGC